MSSEKLLTYTFNDINNKRDFTKNMIYADLRTNIKPFDLKKTDITAQVGFQWYF